MLQGRWHRNKSKILTSFYEYIVLQFKHHNHQCNEMSSIVLAGSTLHSISEHETMMECQLSMMMGKKSWRRGKSCEFWQRLVKKVNFHFSIIKRYVSSAIKVVSFSISSFSPPRRRYMYVNNYNPKSQLEIPSCRPRATITRRQTVYFALSHVPMSFWNSRPVFSIQFNFCLPSICARRSLSISHISERSDKVEAIR